MTAAPRLTINRVFYFGCWNESGHYLRASDGRSGSILSAVCFTGDRVHIDGALAPRRTGAGALCWVAQGSSQREREYLGHRTAECPQGQFLRHVLDNGFTALQWWDRTQGDTRGGCNSTILVEGDRTTEECLAALREHFPQVVRNLETAGVALVEVMPEQK